MEGQSSAPPEDAGTGYSGAPIVGAVLATLCFPLIALIAALLLQGGEPDPREKAQLRTWAWVSGGWMLFVVLLVVLAVGVGTGSGSSSFDRSGPCEGGPKMGAAAKQVPGTTNTFVQPCEFGGSQTITMP